MRISSITIRNFRSISELTLNVDDIAIYIGVNGSGKSAVLYALDWFFNGGDMSVNDFHSPYGIAASNGPIPPGKVEVSIVFTHLNSRDREKLGSYGRGDRAVFKKIVDLSDGKEKILGNALQGPGFQQVRRFKKVAEFRPAYIFLRQTFTELPELVGNFTLDDVDGALIEWESRPENKAKLVEINEEDASHLFGINGTNVITELVRLILIPASTDMTNDVGSVQKGTTLESLVGSLVAAAGNSAREQWITSHSLELEELRALVSSSVSNVTKVQSERISSRLEKLIPQATVHFSTEVPQWSPNVTPRIVTEVSIANSRSDISRQGHGVQRAVLMATFQALVFDEKDFRDRHEVLEGESEIDALDRLERQLAVRPVTVICFEEPEIYQHPVRARALSRLLSNLISDPSIQILLATHSPYFVKPQDFSKVVRFSLKSSATDTVATTYDEVEKSSGAHRANIEKYVEKNLPRSFSESLFAEAVVLVEGETDKAVIEGVAERLGMSLDSKGIVVVEVGGKDSLRIPFAILNCFKIPVYVVVDGDAFSHTRGDEPQLENDASADSHRASTDLVSLWLRDAHPDADSTPYSFGEPTSIRSRYTIWKGDLEGELSTWVSFNEALQAEGGALRSRKDLAKYRAAVMGSMVEDIPGNLRELVETIYSLT